MAKATKKVSMVQAANQVVGVIKGKTTLSALAEQANQLSIDSGGPDKVSAARHHVRRALETAEALGVVKLVRPVDVMVEKVK